jgi:glycine/serine hydroxymethyltransferase
MAVCYAAWSTATESSRWTWHGGHLTHGMHLNFSGRFYR